MNRNDSQNDDTTFHYIGHMKRMNTANQWECTIDQNIRIIVWAKQTKQMQQIKTNQKYIYIYMYTYVILYYIYDKQDSHSKSQAVQGVHEKAGVQTKREHTGWIKQMRSLMKWTNWIT